MSIVERLREIQQAHRAEQGMPMVLARQGLEESGALDLLQEASSLLENSHFSVTPLDINSAKSYKPGDWTAAVAELIWGRELKGFDKIVGIGKGSSHIVLSVRTSFRQELRIRCSRSENHYLGSKVFLDEVLPRKDFGDREKLEDIIAQALWNAGVRPKEDNQQVS